MSRSKDQIQPGMNEIEVMGGSNRLLEMKNDKHYKYRWKIDSAYIMSDVPKVDDIGIMELTKSEFFDKNALKN